MPKKSFDEVVSRKTAALGFISSANAENARAVPRGERAPFAELKTRRLQLLLTQSLYDEMREEAGIQGVSVNALAAAFFKDGLKAARARRV